ncbi:MAG: HDIG domain-containing protein [Clostridia bacterium]|nr:HDIG domain-containing protein [Clostridia bacterium]
MKEMKAKKSMPWSNKDGAKVIFVYVINLIILSLIFLAGVAVRANRFDAFKEFLAHPQDFLSFAILVLLSIGFMAVYFLFEDRDFLHSPINSQMLFLIIELALIACFVFQNYVSQFSMPIALVALLTLFLSDTRKSSFVNVIFSFLLLVFSAYLNLAGGSEMFSLNLIYLYLMTFSSGIVATYLMSNVYSRSKLLVRSLVVSIPCVLCVCLSAITTTGMNFVKELIASACSGPLAVAIFIVFLPIFEGLFKKVSCFKFAELTDHNSKLIKKMIEQAPGTFNHAIIVSNIAEACATAIGEDALLARTCAYYHDIGKLRRPEFFKENQSDVNLHDDLTPELSANIIRSHAQDGYNLLIKNRISEKVANVCLEHHGTTPMLFFYDKAKKFTDGEVDINQFCYAGPKPQTKIAAIMMIADSAEAATRTLTDRSAENVTQVVRSIVNDRMKLGQFEECDITLKELNIIIGTTINTLTGVYHSRVEYPKVTLEGIEIQN